MRLIRFAHNGNVHMKAKDYIKLGTSLRYLIDAEEGELLGGKYVLQNINTVLTLIKDLEFVATLNSAGIAQLNNLKIQLLSIDQTNSKITKDQADQLEKISRKIRDSLLTEGDGMELFRQTDTSGTSKPRSSAGVINSLKDHPLSVAVVLCVATVGATWEVSEQVRILPLKEKIAIEAEVYKASPVISDVKITKIIKDDGEVMEKNIYFNDPEGDAALVNFMVIGTNAEKISVSTGAIDIDPSIQKIGANHLARWECGKDKYFVKFRIIIIDRASHLSRPYDYTVNCNI